MKHISLFSGIGGDTLAAQWAGFETVLFVENDKFCQKVLKKHWPDVPLIGDIKDVTKEKVMAYTDIRESRPRIESQSVRETQLQSSTNGGVRRDKGATSTVSPITLITGGFPCQPVSVAGKQRGKEDDRWLWPEMLRVIKEVRPVWVVAENVAGLIRMGIDDCLSDLEGESYTTETYLIPACAVNAPHRRDRVFIVGYSTGQSRQQERGRSGFTGQTPSKSSPRSQDVADTDREGPQGHRGLRECGGQWLTWQGGEPLEGIWKSEPPVGRVAHGIPNRVDRLKSLGNAIVPQNAFIIMQQIKRLID
ncbi:hypothetical protein LCGC14_1389740 [marine sediment metagenome]|uniref:DNA (cytosine-5-)-methyltransferase n=1 Tax=marine sediment metagenome TaxID=412755 RepID=A0A0F9MFV9_9ZZZZ